MLTNMIEENPKTWDLRCVASTNAVIPPDRVTPSETSGYRETGGLTSNYFKSVDWTADGTSVVTNSADNHLRAFVLPPDLLEDRATSYTLTAFHTIPSKEPIYSIATYPFFSLQDTSTTLLLSSVRDHPIRLNSVLYPGLVASYSLISPTTEAFITPHSILYPASLSGTRFLTGSDSLICVFDISRTGKDGPISRLPTIPSKRKKMVGGGVGMKGIVSTLSEDPAGNGIVAAGTFTRHVGLYASHGSGDTIATFSVAGTEAERRIGGKGITQVLWSPCGRYLYVAERQSNGILVYDIRVTGQLVGWLTGRKAMTNQRLNVDLVDSSDTGSHEIWAGGTDGYVRMWNCGTNLSGEIQPTWEKKIHKDPVSSAVFHPTGSVMATCSGQKFFPSDNLAEEPSTTEYREPSKSRTVDNTLKVWQL